MSRSHNFSPEELHALLSCLESMRSLIMVDGGTEYKTNAEQRKGWEYIACIVNSVGDGDRSAKTVKNKWIDLKYRTKKKFARRNQFLRLGNGAAAARIKISDVEERVLALAGKRTAKAMTAFHCALTPNQINDLVAISDKDDSSADGPLEQHHETLTEVNLHEDRKEKLTNAVPKIKCTTSRDRVRKHRMIKRQNEDNIEDFIKTQKKTYESMKHIEARTQEGIDNGKTIIKNQEKIINRLDSVVMLMSDLNGHMENLNDSLNVLTQVIATKSGIEILESE